MIHYGYLSTYVLYNHGYKCMHEFVCVCGISDMDRGVFFIDSIAFFLIIRRIINAFDAFLSLYLLKICFKICSDVSFIFKLKSTMYGKERAKIGTWYS